MLCHEQILLNSVTINFRLDPKSVVSGYQPDFRTGNGYILGEYKLETEYLLFKDVVAHRVMVIPHNTRAEDFFR